MTNSRPEFCGGLSKRLRVPQPLLHALLEVLTEEGSVDVGLVGFDDGVPWYDAWREAETQVKSGGRDEAPDRIEAWVPLPGLEPGDGRLRGARALGQLLLRQSGAFPRIGDKSGYIHNGYLYLIRDNASSRAQVTRAASGEPTQDYLLNRYATFRKNPSCSSRIPCPRAS